jgi:hypothetical protein
VQQHICCPSYSGGCSRRITYTHRFKTSLGNIQRYHLKKKKSWKTYLNSLTQEVSVILSLSLMNSETLEQRNNTNPVVQTWLKTGLETLRVRAAREQASRCLVCTSQSHWAYRALAPGQSASVQGSDLYGPSNQNNCISSLPRSSEEWRQVILNERLPKITGFPQLCTPPHPEPAN